MDAALMYKKQHPDTSLRSLSTLFNVPKSTLSDRIKSTHDNIDKIEHGCLTHVQEAALVDMIHKY